MPYDGQRAGKTGHTSFFDDELSLFLHNCHYLKYGERKENKIVTHAIKKVTPKLNPKSFIWSSDGSRYVSSVYGSAATTRVGFIKVSQVGFSWEDYYDLNPKKGRFVEPFSVSKLRESVNTVLWMLPGSNIKYGNAKTAKQGFRLRLHELMERDGFYEVLYQLKNEVAMQGCPECGHRFDSKIHFHDSKTFHCPHCEMKVFASDTMGFHKTFEEYGTNEGLYTRMMSAIEAMLFVKKIMIESPEDISKTVFIYDGILGMYGETQWMNEGLLKIFLKIKRSLINQGLPPPIVVGVSKTGQLMHHAIGLVKNMESNDVVPLSLNYRRSMLHQDVDNPRMPFFNSRWGQDFIWKTESGQPIVLSLPFWTEELEEHKETIHRIEQYPEIEEVLGILNEFDSSMYPSAFIPIILAHEEASIAWEPGGRLLTESTRKALDAGCSFE